MDASPFDGFTGLPYFERRLKAAEERYHIAVFEPSVVDGRFAIGVVCRVQLFVNRVEGELLSRGRGAGRLRRFLRRRLAGLFLAVAGKQQKRKKNEDCSAHANWFAAKIRSQARNCIGLRQFCFKAKPAGSV